MLVEHPTDPAFRVDVKQSSTNPERISLFNCLTGEPTFVFRYSARRVVRRMGEMLIAAADFRRDQHLPELRTQQLRQLAHAAIDRMSPTELLKLALPVGALLAR